MVKGALISFLMIFGNSDRVIENYLHGYWVVKVDNTDQNRDPWYRVYYFNKCQDQQSDRSCAGEYGWAIDPGIYENLFDRSYFDYEVVTIKKSDRQILLNDEPFHFLLKAGKRTLKIFDSETDALVMSLEKVKKAELN